MATLYVRNVPDDVYEKLQAWAAENGRSLNAVILEILAEQAERRKSYAEFERRFAELKAKNRPVVGPPWPEDLIREDRDHGHKPEFGY
ncbi:MAG: FitA-like ribbon-helix-helix domain-containing protein [Gaiellaceae bacterium]